MSASLTKLEKICAKNPTSILFARLADEILQQGDVRRASEVCRQGLRYRPSYVTGHVVMGKCYLAAGRVEEARQEFHKVLQLDADHVAAFWHLGQIDLEMGWDELALRNFERAYVLDPFNEQLAAQVESLQRVAVGASPEVLNEEEPQAELVVSEEVETEDPVVSVDVVKEAEQARGTEVLADLVEELDTPASEPEDVAEEQTEKPPEPIATSTLAELYAAQGLIRQAVGILERVAKRDPQNEQVKARLVELQSSSAGQAR
ncbi:MAG: tetratricopeptide repeat protein [bacterium]|nr:tetratricopeptide repeat protein [bacterium]